MKSKGRYNIKLAKKHDILVSKNNSPEGVQAFFDLLTQTTARNHFSGNSQAYYQELCTMLESHDMGGLYLATKDDVVVAGSIFIHYGNLSTYYY